MEQKENIEFDEDEIETEDIVIEKIEEVIIDPKVKEEWDNFNNKWRNKINERRNETKQNKF